MALYSKGVEIVLLFVITALERRSEAYLAWERYYPSEDEITSSPRKKLRVLKYFISKC